MMSPFCAAPIKLLWEVEIMRHIFQLAAWAFLALLIATPAGAAEGVFNGQWRTTFGLVTLKQTGKDITGNYGDTGQFTLKGTAQGKKVTFAYQEGQARGDASWMLDESANAFHGEFKIRGGQSGAWNGWRPDAQALTGKPAKLVGLWLTDLGLMELEQSGDRVNGHYALGGVSEIEGKISGRHFEFSYKGFRSGKGWFDVSSDGKTISGAASTDGFSAWYGWRGRQAPEFAHDAKLVPAKLVDGSTKGLMTYTIRAPENYRPGDGKKWPAILILHGSNMSARAYVSTIAATWPDIARDYLLIGINGEMPSKLGGIGDEPTFNYTYINYVGRSTFKGYPGTDRESPALVAQAMDDLRNVYPISRYFVGGHSQGGFLTYSLLMNFPEKLAGAFPISAGVIFQCEPGAYGDEKLRAAQRSVPLAIIHSKQDPVVSFSSGEYAASLFAESNWPAFHFFADNGGAGHRFALLPVKDAIRWLEGQASDDPKNLLAVADQCVKAGVYRDALAALNRAAALKSDPATQSRLDRLTKEIDAKAAPAAKEFLLKIKSKPGKDWIDPFLDFRDKFEFAPAARETIEAFAALRAEQDSPAAKAMSEARAAFQQGRPDQGWAKYQEIVDKYYAASSYRSVKRWLLERK
jgi:predicted esterase